jgi:agmatinase
MSSSNALIPFAGCFTSKRSVPLVFVGIPDDSQSSYRPGCAGGPDMIRSAYDGRSFNSTTESGVNLAESVLDHGNLEAKDTWEFRAKAYRDAIRSLVGEGKRVFVAGGDHAITVPVVDGYSALGQPIHVIQIDAHPDLYFDFEGSKGSHACVAARLLEMNFVASVTQLGIRTLNDKQTKQVEKHRDRLRIHFAKDLEGPLPELGHIPAGAPVYLTVDLDGIDPGFAPGVSHPVPGGLTPRQVSSFLQRSRWDLVGMDVVELNPSTDLHNLTAILAARLLHEGMGLAAKELSKT